MNHHRMFTRMIRACMAAALVTLAGIGSATAQNTESFSATHFAVPENQNEVPPVQGDAGYAVAIMRFDPFSSSLEYRVTVALPSGQSIIAAHFHRGVRGENGPPVHDIVFAANNMTATGVWSNIGSGELSALMTQGIYINIHTNVNQSGQLRDQVNIIPNLTATQMSSLEETPPIPGLPGTGNAFIYLDQTTKRAVYMVDWDSLTGPPTMAHFHRGEIGVAGPPIHTIPIPSGAGAKGYSFGIWDNISDTDIADLKSGRIYANIHTNQHQPGEIRGQVVLTEMYTAAISPANEVPPVTGSNGTGTGLVTIHGKKLLRTLFIVHDMTGPASMAHIHQAPKGTNGDIEFNLLGLAFGGYPGVWLSFTDTLDGNDHTNFQTGAMYANFHTAQHQSGEIRGQLIPSASILDLNTGSVPHTRPAGMPEVVSWYDRSSGMLHLRAEDREMLHDAVVEIYSPLGARVAAVPVPEGADAVGTGSLATGIYFVQILNNGTIVGAGRVAVVR